MTIKLILAALATCLTTLPAAADDPCVQVTQTDAASIDAWSTVGPGIQPHADISFSKTVVRRTCGESVEETTTTHFELVTHTGFSCQRDDGDATVDPLGGSLSIVVGAGTICFANLTVTAEPDIDAFESGRTSPVELSATTSRPATPTGGYRTGPESFTIALQSTATLTRAFTVSTDAA